MTVHYTGRAVKDMKNLPLKYRERAMDAVDRFAASGVGRRARPRRLMPWSVPVAARNLAGDFPDGERYRRHSRAAPAGSVSLSMCNAPDRRDRIHPFRRTQEAHPWFRVQSGRADRFGRGSGQLDRISAAPLFHGESG